MNNAVDQQIKAVLHGVVAELLPATAVPDTLIAPHVWRDSTYVGAHSGRVVAWRGWRVNFALVDSRYRTLYIDVVENALPEAERQRLFGEAFSQAVSSMTRFVVLFALDFPLQAEADIVAHGFIPRRLSRVLHACRIVSPDEFLAAPVAQWTADAIHLLKLQNLLGGSAAKAGEAAVSVPFRLRFEPEEIAYWADRYQYPGEDEISQRIAPRIIEQAFCGAADLIALCEWKSPRIRSRCAANDPAFIEAITRLALTTPHERLRVEILTLLSGVAWPMASVILHWCHTEPYPILDFRALWSLGVEEPPMPNTFEFWQDYTLFCRELTQQAGVSMRTLDRALWQYSKENQK